MDEIEDEAKAAAEKMVMNMMQRPGQLEKVRKKVQFYKIRALSFGLYYIFTLFFLYSTTF